MSALRRVSAHILSVLTLVLTPFAAHAASSPWSGDRRAEVRLVTSVDSVQEDTLQAGIEFRYPPGWHGYWRTPGDAGIAPILDWAASRNVESTSMTWPAPSRLVVSGLQNSVYTGDFVLPVKIKLKKAHETTHIALTIDYATCANVCVPIHSELALTLPAGNGERSGEAPKIDAAVAAVPRTPADAGMTVVHSDVEATSSGRQLNVLLRSNKAPFRSPDLFVENAGAGLPAAPQVRLSADRREATLRVTLPSVHEGTGPFRLTVVDGARAAEFETASVAPLTESGRSIAIVLCLALLGGLILNFMPCVLPVLSIKVFSVVKAAGAERLSARRISLATALGIIASFLTLAAALSTLKLAGTTLGWGVQFQQPWFLAGMAVVTTLFAASLFDWLPIGLPNFVSGGQSSAAGRGPLVEAFLGGMLSTLLATPCSAPLVGTVVGFALARGPLEIIVVLLTLGAGMALPFLILAAAPSLAAKMPRPGRWMLHLRKVMGVLLLATSAWLTWSLWTIGGALTASVVGAALLGLLGLRAFVASRAITQASRWPGTATALIVAGTVGFAVLAPSIAARPDASGEWQTFDSNAISPLVASGKIVLVDVTASWCLTCKVNELSVLDTAAVRSRLEQDNIVRMRADWSRYNPQIARYIQSFGRFGIPLDVVYGPNRPQGQLLPEILQASTLFQAIDSAKTSQSAGNDNSGVPAHGYPSTVAPS
ncbi:protein-disulfide reductase DsbD family protein [Paraburkholderia caribensis]|uniref:protein-disulfide reductase DsbD family protein n=1 Tax=Paraburkholderia caribensis TaxID=75105 RepID=UPI001CAF1655|nr:protein-disulfide reductase DsbD domain-containing protein [Paraburkholderia caribensis]CAG9262596.1 Cytochrome c-type biogenesis protein DsbD, protein-disulfide reductase [Paraburkholderia caribensis]